MKKTFKYRMLAWRTKRHAKRHEREKRYIDYAHAQRILLLCENTAGSPENPARHAADSLMADGKQVTTCCYTERPLATPAGDIAICKKDLGPTGKPTQALKTLAQHRFDLVIDLTTAACMPLLYVLLHADAPCKAGLQHTDLPLLDFIMACPDGETGTDKLYEHILFYLKNIRSND